MQSGLLKFNSEPAASVPFGRSTCELLVLKETVSSWSAKLQTRNNRSWESAASCMNGSFRKPERYSRCYKHIPVSQSPGSSRQPAHFCPQNTFLHAFNWTHYPDATCSPTTSKRWCATEMPSWIWERICAPGHRARSSASDVTENARGSQPLGQAGPAPWAAEEAPLCLWWLTALYSWIRGAPALLSPNSACLHPEGGPARGLLAGVVVGASSSALDLKGMGHETCSRRSVGCYFLHITM